MTRIACALTGALLLAAGAAAAGEADVLEVAVVGGYERNYTFEVTVRHADEGWDHYADKWDVVAPDGTVLGTRTLHHPHVNEQPFTRSLRDVQVPAGIDQVTIRAHDSVHGYGGQTVTVKLRN
jgi:hypothetical protein